MKTCIPILLALLLISPALASGENPWKAYTDPNYVSGIALDGDIIWCATRGGVLQRNRIDGSCRVYTIADGLPANLIDDIAIDSRGTVWCIAGSAYVASFDGVAWKTYIPGKDLPQTAYYWTVAAGENGAVWIGAREGLIRYDGVKYTQYTAADGLPVSEVISICPGPEDTVWAGTVKGLARFDGQAWKVFTTADGLPGDGIHDIAFDGWGNLWVATGGGVARFDGSAWKSWTEADGLGQNIVYRIAPGKNGEAWASGPLWYGRFDGNSWKSFPRDEPRIHGGALEVDSDNAVWADDGSVGLRRYTGDAWERFTVPGLLHCSASEVYSGVVDRNNVKWFGNRHSLASFDGVAWKNYDPVDWSSLHGVTALAVDSGNRILAGTWDGLFRFDGTAWSRYPQADGLSGITIRTIAVSESGVIWVGTGNSGLFAFDGADWKAYTTENGLPHNQVTCMALDRKGILWAATGKGIVRFDGAKWTTFPYKTYLGSENATSIAVDRGDVKWFGSKGVFVSFDNTTWKTWTEQEIGFPLGTSTVSSIAVDKNNVKWFGTSIGILRFDGVRWDRYISLLRQPADTPYTEAIPVQLGSIKVALADRNNEIWFGCTNSGVVSYRGAMTGTPVSIASRESLPAGLSFRGVYPNPFNPLTTLEFATDSEGLVTVDIYNVAGQKIRRIVSGNVPPGMHKVIWNGHNDSGKPLSSGVYFARLRQGSREICAKMLLAR